MKETQNERLERLTREMLEHAVNSGTVVYCGPCKNTKVRHGVECKICK